MQQIRDQADKIKELEARLANAHLTESSSPPVAIQEWIDKARENFNTADLEPAVVSPESLIPEHEESEDDEEGQESESEHLSPPREIYGRQADGSGTGGPAATMKSPAVGTTLSPIGMIAASALKSKRVRSRRGSQASGSNDEGKEEVGVANASYFKPGQ